MANRIKTLIVSMRRTDVTADDLLKALVEARSELATAEITLDRAGTAYQAGLLEHDDARLQSIRAQRDEAELTRDRAAALVASLETREREARLAEKRAQFEAARASVDADARRVAEKIGERYPRLAKDLIDLLKDISAVDKRIKEMNKIIDDTENGGERLQSVQARILPHPGPHRVQFCIWSSTFLLEIPGFAPGWHVHQFNAHAM